MQSASSAIWTEHQLGARNHGSWLWNALMVQAWSDQWCFYIVTVPTPIDSARRPDLGAMLAASGSVGAVLKRGDIVVYESTVYPGAVEEDCAPVLEKASGLKAGSDFMLGYSPERINPGDTAHRFESIVKVVSAQDEKTLDIVADVYGSVVKAGIHRAPSIKVAEAAESDRKHTA